MLAKANGNRRGRSLTHDLGYGNPTTLYAYSKSLDRHGWLGFDQRSPSMMGYRGPDRPVLAVFGPRGAGSELSRCESCKIKGHISPDCSMKAHSIQAAMTTDGNGQGYRRSCGNGRGFSRVTGRGFSSENFQTVNLNMTGYLEVESI